MTRTTHARSSGPPGTAASAASPATVAAAAGLPPGGNRGVPDPDVRGQFARSVRSRRSRRGRVRHSRRTILPAYDPLFDSKVRHILVRHEQGAGHAATGYAQAPARSACVSRPPGRARRLVTAIADAYMDSVPIVAITGQVTRATIGTDAFQEATSRGSRCRSQAQLLGPDAREIPEILAEAFHLASTGRPGPVLVDIRRTCCRNRHVSRGRR